MRVWDRETSLREVGERKLCSGPTARASGQRPVPRRPTWTTGVGERSWAWVRDRFLSKSHLCYLPAVSLGKKAAHLSGPHVSAPVELTGLHACDEKRHVKCPAGVSSRGVPVLPSSGG